MKILIASDIHGDLDSMNAVIRAYQEEGADRILLLGDLLYHGPRNDLPKTYNPKAVIEILNGYSDSILTVRGNCDTEVDQMVLKFPILADYTYVCIDGLSIFATHGHHHNTATPPPLRKGEILLHGHTHVLKCEPFGNENYYINPGSIALPKENNPRTYMIYENRKFVCKSVNGDIIFEKQF